MLKKLTYQSLLSVSELDSFLSEFLRICSLPVDEPEVENREVLLEDIRLANKIRFFSEALAAYQLCIRRARKMSQTEVLVQLKEQRAEQFLCHLACIYSYESSTDEAKSTAAKLYAPLLDQFKYFRQLSNAGQTAMIQEYIAAIQGEKYTEAFQTLNLEERTTELQMTNEQYASLSTERADEMKNMPASPSEMRRQCVRAYRQLVDLINFAEANNKYYIYDECISLLSAITQETQELVNRRKNERKGVKVENEDAAPKAPADTETTDTGTTGTETTGSEVTEAVENGV